MLPIAGFIIYRLYRDDVQASFDGQLLKLVNAITVDSMGSSGDAQPLPPSNLYEPLFEVTHSGWYWQITPLTPANGRKLVSPSLATGSLPSPAGQKVKCRRKRRALAQHQGPQGRAATHCRGDRLARPRAGQAHLFDRRRRPAGLARPSRRQLPLSLDDGAGLGGPRPRRRDAVPGAVRAAAAAPDRARPCRYPLRHLEHARGRPAGRDRAAAVRAQRAHPVQPGDRRPRPHAGRQPGACLENTARRHRQ